MFMFDKMAVIGVGLIGASAPVNLVGEVLDALVGVVVAPSAHAASSIPSVP